VFKTVRRKLIAIIGIKRLKALYTQRLSRDWFVKNKICQMIAGNIAMPRLG